MERKAILSFAGVTLLSDTHHAANVAKVSFEVASREIVLVLVEDHARYIPLCDLAEGLVEPHHGHVNFMGEDWLDMTNQRQADRRGRIGRVFDSQGWVSNLSVYDNIVLSQCHHTRRPEGDIHRDAERLADRVGLRPIPQVLPEIVPLADLRRAEWVRAFLGDPCLVLLEQPERGMPADSVSRLMDLTLAAAASGTAVVWMTTRRDCWEDRRLTSAKRFSIENDAWITHSGGQDDRKAV